MSSEQQIQSSIIKYLESINSYVVKIVSANKSGVPDICACIQGRWLSIECKRPGFQPEPLQLHHLNQIQKAGGLATWATSVTQVQDFLAQNNITSPKEEDI